MQFSELVLQGVRNFVQLQRIPLSGGFVVFYGEKGAGKSTVVDVVVHLLYPNPIEPATEAFRSPGGVPCRVSLMIEQGGERYRLVKDLAAGSLALTRADPQTGRFAAVTSAAAEILSYLTSQLHLPQQDVLKSLYLIGDSGLPSALPARPAPASAVVAPTAGPLQPAPGAAAAFPGYQGADAEEQILPDDPEELRFQIQTLERDLGWAGEVDELQFRLDGLQAEIFEIDQKLKGVKEALSRVEQLEQGLQEFCKLTELPEDFEKRVREYDRARAKLDRDMGRLDEEQHKWELRAQQSAPEPLRRNRVFLAGLLLGVLALAVGVAGFIWYEGLRYLALLDIVGFGMATAVAVRHIDRLRSLEQSGTRLRLVAERREKLQRQFDLESTIVRKIMAEVGAQNPGAIIEQYNRRAKLLAEIKRARGEAEKQRQDPALAEAESRRAALQEQAAEIEGRLADAGGMMMSPREMERKIKSLRAKLQRLEPAEPSAEPAAEAVAKFGQEGGFLGATDDQEEALGFGGGSPPVAAVAPPQPGPPRPGLPPPAYGEVELSAADGGGALDPFRAAVRAADDLFLVGRERLEQIVAPRASQYLAALSEGAYSQVAFGPDGSVKCVAAGSSNAMDCALLPAAVQDLACLGLKLAVVELYSRRQPVPLLLDDPFKRISPDRLDMLGRMLAELGKHTQVVLFTSQAAMAQHATASFKL